MGESRRSTPRRPGAADTDSNNDETDGILGAARALSLRIDSASVTASASSLLRRARARASTVQALSSGRGHAGAHALPFLCLDIACSQANVPFVKPQVAASAACVSVQQYARSRVYLCTQLAPANTTAGPSTPDNHTRISSSFPSRSDAPLFDSLAVRFGCMHAISAARSLHTAFVDTYKAKLSGPQRAAFDPFSDAVINAVFFSVCSAFHTRIPRKERDAVNGSDRTVIRYEQWIQSNCAEVLAELVSVSKSVSVSVSKSGSTPILNKKTDEEICGVDLLESKDRGESVSTGPSQEPKTPQKQVERSGKRKHGESTSSGASRSRPLTGINILIKTVDPRTTKKYMDYTTWRDRILKELDSSCASMDTMSTKASNQV